MCKQQKSLQNNLSGLDEKTGHFTKRTIILKLTIIWIWKRYEEFLTIEGVFGNRGRGSSNNDIKGAALDRKEFDNDKQIFISKHFPIHS